MLRIDYVWGMFLNQFHKILTSISLLLLLLCSSVFGQDKLVIGMSEKVSYHQSEYVEIDSVVSIVDSNKFHYGCTSIEVYFDDSLKKSAYKSFQSNDSCFNYHYWRNGKLKQLIVYKCQSEDEYKNTWWYHERFCKNGQALFKGPTPNQLQKKHYINYYCNGNKQLEFDHIGIGAEGKMTSWHENGKLQCESHFKDDKRIGTWRYWNVEGRLIKEEVYERDVLKKTMQY